MTLKKTLILSLLLLTPQHTKPNFLYDLCKNVIIKPVAICGGILVPIGIFAFWRHNRTIENAQKDCASISTKWGAIIETHQAGNDWCALIISTGSWGLSQTPLHAFETELIQAINRTHERYTETAHLPELQTIRSQLLALNTSLQAILRSFAALRGTQDYANEESVLLRSSIGDANYAMRVNTYMPKIALVHNF